MDWDREAFLENDDLPPRKERSYRTGREIIVDVVDEKGEAWVLENYYTDLHPLNRLVDLPPKEELPFFDPEEHEVWADEDIAEMYRLRAEYIENLKAQSKTSDDTG